MAEMMGQALGAGHRRRSSSATTASSTTHDAATLRDVGRGHRRLAAGPASSRSSVVHGDYRLDNLLFPPPGDDVVAVDWQTAAVGPPLRDVAYFLGTSLDDRGPAGARGAARGRLPRRARRPGRRRYDADRCWDDYRLGQLQGPMITVLGCMYATGERTERVRRHVPGHGPPLVAAIRDLGSLDLV